MPSPLIVQLPNEDDLPPGPQRDLTWEIHKLYRAAGYPGLRQISRSIRQRSDLPATVSHEGGRTILQGTRPGRWQGVDSVVRVLASLATEGSDPDQVSGRLQHLWLAIIEEHQRKVEEAPLTLSAASVHDTRAALLGTSGQVVA